MKTMSKTITVSSKAQIVIPSDIRDFMGINKGDKLFIFCKNGYVMLTKMDNTILESMIKEYKSLSTSQSEGTELRFQVP